MNIHSTVRLNTGRTMPILGLGTWGLTHDTADIIAAALILGYPMIDTSGDYGTQPGIGDGIKKSRLNRESFYLVTKVEETDDAYEAVKKNLRELDLEYADLILIHRPPKDDAGVELWQGLILAQEEGLAKDVGVSNYSAAQIQSLINDTGVTPVVNQIEWSPFGWSQPMLDYCDSKDIVVQGYSPITHGKRLHDKTVAAIAKEYRKTPSQILIRWSMQKGVVPLPKANQKEHLQQNIDVFNFELTTDDMNVLDELNESYSALGERPAYLLNNV